MNPFFPFILFLRLLLLQRCQLRLHFLECGDKGIKIFDVEHDGRLLATTGLFGNLKEFAVTGFLQVDVKRPLTCLDGDRVHILGKLSSASAIVVRTGSRTWCRWARWLDCGSDAERRL